MFDRPELNNPHFGDCYFSYDEGLEESLYVFVDGNGFPDRLESRNTWTIAETGYGTGLNLMALLTVMPEHYSGTIDYYSVEKYPLSRERIVELLGETYSKIKTVADVVLSLYATFDIGHSGWVQGGLTYGNVQVRVHLYVGDVLEYMEALPGSVDVWFLDGHSPDKNPDMWSENVLSSVGKHSKIGSTLATFSAAGIVKSALREAGFTIKRRKGFGGKRHMIQGIFDSGSRDVTS